MLRIPILPLNLTHYPSSDGASSSPVVQSFASLEDRRMDKTKLEKLVRLSGKATAKALAALERRGYDLRGKLSAPINRVPRRSPPPKPKSDD